MPNCDQDALLDVFPRAVWRAAFVVLAIDLAMVWHIIGSVSIPWQLDARTANQQRRLVSAADA
jgi:hypothetical protein